MYRRAIELNPNYATARHWYSDMLGDVGRLDEALAQIERAVELDPLSAIIRHTLGEALERKGRFQDAENAYRKATTIDPSRPGSYVALSDLTAYALGRPADAVPLARKAMALDPGSPLRCRARGSARRPRREPGSDAIDDGRRPALARF